MSQPPQTPPPPGGWPPPPGWTPPAAPPASAGGWGVLPPAPPTAAPEPPAGGPGMTLPPGWRPQPPVHKPGVVALQPLNVNDLFTGTFATLRGHWRPLLTVATAVAAFMALAAIPAMISAEPAVREVVALATLDPSATTSETQDALRAFTDALVSFAPWLLLMFVLSVTAGAIIEAGTAIVVGRAVLGRTITGADVLVQLRPLLPRLLLLGLLMAITIGVGIFLCVIPGLLMAFVWFAAPSVVAMEDASAVGALRRSAKLVGQSFWRVVGVLLLVQLVYGVAIQVVTTPISFVFSAGAIGAASQVGPSQGAINLMLIGYLVLGLVGIVSYPLIAVARVLEYLDLRMRHERLAETLIEATK